jgi:hypothetical protein
MQYRYKGRTIQYAAIFHKEPDVTYLFDDDTTFLEGGKAADVERLVQKALQFIRQRPGGEFETPTTQDMSSEDTAELERNLKEHAERADVEYASFEHFELATNEGGEDGGPLLRSAWLYESANLQGFNQPISSGCNNLGPNLNKRVSSVAINGGLLLFEEFNCQILQGQLPLLLTSAAPVAIPDLGAYKRLASSAYTWG